MFEIGQILDNKYEITEHIGTGGGGVVYKANQIGLNRPVAIKQIKDNVVGVLKDRGEADILKNLKNNFIPSVYDFIESDGEVYTVMEFVYGQSFQQLMDSGKRFSQKSLMKYAHQLCEAVSYLHSRKPPVIHSDIKPANIMLTPEDNICLIDYNISLIIDGSENAIGVSDGYSPPEQYASGFKKKEKTSSYAASEDMTLIDDETLIDTKTLTDGETLIDDETLIDGETLIDKTVAEKSFEPKGISEEPCGEIPATSQEVNERSDIYSIGASLYGIALGKRPETSTGNVTKLADKDSGVGESFASIIDKAMEKDPVKRFGSAEQMLKALNNIRRYDSRYKRMIIRQEIAIFTVIAAMACTCLMAVIGYTELGNEDSDRYDSIVAEMDNADIKTAEELYSEAAALFPERAESYEKMAIHIYQSGDYTSAEEFIKNTIALGTLYTGKNGEKYSFGKLYYLLGRSCMETGDYDSSAEFLGKAIAENGGEVSYYCDYASALARCGKASEAEKILETATDIGLSDANILFVKAEIELAEGNYAESIKNIKGCIKAVPDSDYLYRAYMIGANAYSEEFEKSPVTGAERIEFLSEASEAVSVEKSLPFYEMLAEAYIKQADVSGSDSYLSEAIKTYEKIDSRGWATANTYYIMIRLYRQTGNLGYAKEFAKNLLEKDGSDYVIYKLLAFIESDIQAQKNNSDRNYSEFCSYYERAAALCTDEEDPEMLLLADAYKNAKERKK